MQKIPFSLDWTRGSAARRFGPETGVPVDLPDDFIIGKERDPHTESGPSTGFYPGGRAVYRKTFPFDPAWKDRTVLLLIDGAYMNTEVVCNGDLLALHPYGYTPFLTDLTPVLKDRNEIAVTTEAVQLSSRWYSGGGLYREVSLLVGGPCFLHPWDVFLYTLEADRDRAVLKLRASVTNPGQERRLTFRAVLDGTCLWETEVCAAQGRTPVETELTVTDPVLWSAEAPRLCGVSLVLLDGEEVLDVHEMQFGIRKIEIDSVNGMRVNGESIKLRGGCVHHDNSLIGSRALPRAEERKVEKLKAAGFNAIRCAHNPPSEALLDACDRLGMYVLDESFDMWRVGKNARDYHLYFEKWWREDTAAMVRRDRNHPCVYAWSIGNEISEMNGSSDGAYWAETQADFVRSLDPTRPVSSSVNFMVFPKDRDRSLFMRRDHMKEELMHPKVSDGCADGYDYWDEATRETLSPLDIAGYNYMWPRYALDAEKHPDRVIHATETHSWHMYDYWQAVRENPNCIGDFTWTATDNLGEAGAGRVIWDLDEGFSGLIGAWPWLSCFQGDLDLDLRRRPQSWYRGVVWGLDRGIHLFTTHPDKTGKPFYGMGWHWEEVRQDWTFGDGYVGKPVQLEAYCDCDEVLFVCNGEPVGRVRPEKHKAFLTVPYRPGKVEAVAFRDGKEAARTCLETTGRPERIGLEPDRAVLRADGMDLSYVTVRITDAEGGTVVRDDVTLRAEAEVGEILGFGSANPCTEENYTDERRVYCGYALLCIRSRKEPGQIRVKVTGEGLAPAETVLRCE